MCKKNYSGPYKLPHLFGFKTESSSFQTDPNNLDQTYKTDLDLWESLGKVKPISQQNFTGMI